MKIKDIRNQKWVVDKDFKVTYMHIQGISSCEQECHFNIVRNMDNILIDCTYQTLITELSQSAFFVVQSAIVSKLYDNYEKIGVVLGVRGYMLKTGLTIRKKQRVFSEKEIIERSERMKRLNKAGKLKR